MPHLPALMDAICTTYDNAVTGDFRTRKKYMPTPDDPTTPQVNEAVTWCNFAVRDVAEAMGYFGFKTKTRGMLANEMVALMQKNLDWFKISPDEAQNYANNGHLTLAGIVDRPHGHVCVIRPGRELYSEKWKKAVPMVMNVGEKNFISHHLGFAFKEEPQVFVWRGTNDDVG